MRNGACAPSSKLDCYEQWRQEEVHLEGAAELELQHLYRAMDFLEANKEAIEKATYFRMADLLNLEVEIVFYDTTSLHFEIDEEDRGVGDRDEVRGSLAAGRKSYRTLRKRGHSRNGRFDAQQIVVGVAVTRDGFPVRHWIFPGNTVDVTTIDRVKKDLQGWQLSRGVFVGDAGMVSHANLETLGRLGGELVALHLLESPKVNMPITEFIGNRSPEVEKVSWSKNTVWVDKAQTTGFKGVREDVWNFRIDGYQVCNKWLKDRKGRTLSKDDIAHYQKIVVALAETIRLMKEIDEVIKQHGGWPGAFAAKGATAH